MIGSYVSVFVDINTEWSESPARIAAWGALGLRSKVVPVELRKEPATNRTTDVVPGVGERPATTHTATTSSLDALEAFRKDPQSFDLVVTDQTMPRLTGYELSERLVGLRKDVPVILCTGFSNMVTSKRLAEAGIDVVVPKPVGVRQLADAVARILK